MASNVFGNDALPGPTESSDRCRRGAMADTVNVLLRALTSLQLTVVLLAMAIFIVLAGTMAQVEKGIWQVTDEYFRTAVAWIDLRIFFPPHWFPGLAKTLSHSSFPVCFPFPGGWLIGVVMAVNLLSSYIARIEVPARGARLAGGVAVTLLGAVMTWLVIISGSNKDDMGNLAEIEWSTLWLLMKVALAAIWLAAGYGLVKIDRGRRLEWWTLLASAIGLGGLLGWLWYTGAAMNESSLRILWQLIKGGLASLVLLAGCVMLFRNHAGVVLLHAGILLMMLGELLVGTRAVEGHMRIEEGRAANYVEQSRMPELAIVAGSDSAQDQVVAVPATMLRPGTTIQHAALPFNLNVIKYFANSAVHKVLPGGPNPATAGRGLRQIAVEEPMVSGTDNRVDLASAYLELTNKTTGESYGTYLFAQIDSYEGEPEEVAVDGKSYRVSLRPKRIYKPYSIRLVDFRFDKYLGTSKAKNFSSDVHLQDPSRGVDRDVRIWMNNPLRYAGETFYQSGFDTDRASGAEVTVLQVVSNSSWMIPYVSCVIVATGMLSHFGIVLVGFLRRRAATEAGAGVGHEPGAPAGPRRGTVALPLLVVAGAALLLGYAARRPGNSAGEMELYDFGRLPLAYEGRIKPFDTLARNSLAIISGKQTFKDATGTRQPAIRWLLDVITGADAARHHQVFRIDNLDVLHTLGLERRRGFRYAVDEISAKADAFSRQVGLARARKKEDLTVYQRKILELANKIQVYRLLEESFHPAQIRKGHEAEDLAAAMRHAEQLAQYQPPLAVPGQGPTDQAWQSFAAAWADVHAKQLHGQQPNRAAVLLSSILNAYRQDDAGAFNGSLAQYWQLLSERPPAEFDLSKANLEARFNHSQPFLWCAILYVLAFVLAALAWLGWTRPLNRAAFWLIVVTLAVHTAALVARVYISGRPPVTNLYSSAIFIGWGCVVLGLLIEIVYRLGIGNVLAATAGFATLLVAFFLSRQGDTFVVLQAVLDTQFWLATHVTCITFGYATTFVAGCLGLLYVIRGVCTPSLSPAVGKDLSRMIYGTICFSILFSFVGTVLGGLWADDSWGRFWGWDPKENGALIIVLWNALVLHARWGRMVGDRGLAVLAIGGNICTAWSWFGVNELGVGLHSYGFTEGVLLGLGIFCLTQVAVIALGLLPLDLWWSYRRWPSAPGGADG